MITMFTTAICAVLLGQTGIGRGGFGQNGFGTKPYPGTQKNSAAAFGKNDIGLGLTNIFTWKTGTDSLIRQQSLYVLRTEADYFQYWSRSTGQRGESAPRGIDWQKQMLVAVHLGSRNTAGFYLDLMRSDVVNGHTIMLRMRERTPNRGEYVAQVTTSPWVLIRLDKTANDFQTTFTTQEGSGVQVYSPNGTTVIRQGTMTITVPGRVIPLPDDGWCDYYSGADSFQNDEGVVYLNDQSQLEDYWVNTLRLNIQQMPQGIDWSRERIATLHLGARPTLGYAIKVNKVSRNNGKGIIVIEEKKPQNPSMIKGRATTPFTMVRLDRSVRNWDIQFAKK